MLEQCVAILRKFFDHVQSDTPAHANKMLLLMFSVKNKSRSSEALLWRRFFYSSQVLLYYFAIRRSKHLEARSFALRVLMSSYTRTE